MIKVPTRAFANSSFAIIEIGTSFLLQKRDNKNCIWYPSMIGLFGGKIENKENELDALKREITEETNINIKKFFFLNSFLLKNKNKYYSRYDFYKKIIKLPKNFRVTEGEGYLLVNRTKLASLKNIIVPTDYISLSNYLRIKYNYYLM